MKNKDELKQEITRWRGIQENLSDLGVRNAVCGDPVLPGGQLPQEDVIALIGLVQLHLDDLAWQAGEDLRL